MDNKITHMPPKLPNYIATKADRENDLLLKEWRQRQSEEARMTFLRHIRLNQFNGKPLK